MKPLVYAGFAAAALLVASLAAAQPAALVEGVQSPAWVQRAGTRTPIAPGMALQPGDVVHTGAGARLLVRLSERSLVKLGENGQLGFTELAPTLELFRAALSVLQGAFRFTTDVAAKTRRREVNVTVATVTAGIRGTDFWGRSRDNTEIVCLIEGAVEVAAPNELPVRMDQPRQFYRRVAGRAHPIGLVEPAQLQEWARETEIQAGRGAARAGGRFRAELGRADNQSAALRTYDAARAAGYAAEIRPVREGGELTYIVVVRSLATRADARLLEAKLKGRL